MDGHQRHCVSSLVLDTSDPDFPRQSLRSTDEVRCEIAELVAKTKTTIAESRALIAKKEREMERWRIATPLVEKMKMAALVASFPFRSSGHTRSVRYCLDLQNCHIA